MSHPLNAKTPLLPCPQSMTVRAEQPQVVDISLPFNQTSSPIIGTITGALFHFGGYMVDVKKANIGDSTFCTHASESLDNRNFSRPIPQRFLPRCILARNLAVRASRIVRSCG